MNVPVLPCDRPTEIVVRRAPCYDIGVRPSGVYTCLTVQGVRRFLTRREALDLARALTIYASPPGNSPE